VTTSEPTDQPPTSSGRWRLVALGIAALVVVAAAVVLLADRDDDSEESVPSTSPAIETTTPADTTSPTEPPSTTTPSETTSPTDPPVTDPEGDLPDEAAAPAVWPWADSTTRFADPVEAATSFATEFLDMTDPLVGEFRAGDSRSGEVELQATALGPVTTVLVRQLTEDDSWWVLGSAAENITLEEPETGAMVQSPLTLAGSALAFEGTVDVEVRVDGVVEPIATGFVTASGGPEPGPFEGSIEFDDPGEGSGALVLISRSSEDGAVLEASVIRLVFG